MKFISSVEINSLSLYILRPCDSDYSAKRFIKHIIIVIIISDEGDHFIDLRDK